MKKVYTLLLFVLVSLFMIKGTAYTQVPDGFNYQGVARDNSGNPIINSSLTVRVAVISQITPEVVEWEEEHSVTTNSYGLFTLMIGDPDATGIGGSANSIGDIDWAGKTLYIRTSVRYNSTWYDMDAARILAVPYALLAKDVQSRTLEVNADTVFRVEGSLALGTDSPQGAKLAVVSTNDASEDALFEVRRQDGQPVFSVYNTGVKVFVDDIGTKGPKGGFAIGGFDAAKGSQDYLIISPDSIRMFIKNTSAVPGKGAGSKGGFAIGGFDDSKAGLTDLYFNVSGKDAMDVYENTSQVLWYPRKEAFLSGNIRIGSPDSVGTNSTAMGFKPVAMGNYSQAFGYKTLALADNSTAIGNRAQASGIDSYAFGSGAIASGQKSFAFGSIGIDEAGNPLGISTLASGDYSIALGMGAQATTIGAMALGVNSLASGYASSAMGFYSQATKKYSVAIGYYAMAQGDYANAFGRSAQANGVSSTAVGYATLASGSAAASFGRSAVAGGTASLSLGYSSDALNTYSVAIGFDAQSSGEYSSSMGYMANASGNYSTAIGHTAIANKENSYSIGKNAQSTGINAFALGIDAVASGGTSLSMGYSSSAGGSYSLAIGNSNNSSSTNSISLGNSNTSSNTNSIAIGNNNTASGVYSTALGYASSASGYRSVAIGSNYYKSSLIIIIPTLPTLPTLPLIPILPKGDTELPADGKGWIILPPSINRDNQAIGDYSIAVGAGNYSTNGGMAFGVYNNAEDVYATAIGFGNHALGKYSLAAGFANQTNGMYSVAFGTYTTAEAMNSFVIGKYNYTSSAYDPDDWVETNPLFVIGNGTSSSSPNDAMIVYKNGYTYHEARDAYAGIYAYNYISGRTSSSYGIKSYAYGTTAAYVYSGHFTGGNSVNPVYYMGLWADKRSGALTDVAEYIYDTNGNTEAGDVIVADPNLKESVILSGKPYQESVLGVVSTDPHLTMGMDLVTDEETGDALPGVKATKLALTGRVPVKVTDENGPIKPGDMLTSSSTPGHAMKWSLLDITKAKDFDELKKMIAENDRRRNAVIGKAVDEHLSGTGRIIALISL
ncbi:MAG TPA: hypothetical protein VMW76_03345 [Bacteroidales bacterium]|nr:hypothetical protein [Bacteroidales bacterium]